MNVTLIAVDKLREPYLRNGCDLYVSRLAPYAAISIVEIRPAAGPNAIEADGRAILDRIGDGATLWALDREGESLMSIALARKFADVERSGSRRLSLAIGGPDGLHRSVLEAADFRWSLSDLTLLHEMARLVVLEQLYRAMKINRGEPYHR